MKNNLLAIVSIVRNNFKSVFFDLLNHRRIKRK